MALGERAVLAGVEVERVSLFGFQVASCIAVLDAATAAELVGRWADREQERLRAGAADTAARIAELRRQHGRALRVTGGARAKRARWTKAEAWLVVSYPKAKEAT